MPKNYHYQIEKRDEKNIGVFTINSVDEYDLNKKEKSVLKAMGGICKYIEKKSKADINDFEIRYEGKMTDDFNKLLKDATYEVKEKMIRNKEFVEIIKSGVLSTIPIVSDIRAMKSWTGHHSAQSRGRRVIDNVAWSLLSFMKIGGLVEAATLDPSYFWLYVQGTGYSTIWNCAQMFDDFDNIPKKIGISRHGWYD